MAERARPRRPARLAASDSFAARVREETQDAHEAAEQAPYLHRLLNGDLSTSALSELLVQYSFIYAALEEATDQLADDPVVSTFDDPRLRRQPRLAHDLDRALGPGWAAEHPCLPSTASYVERLQQSRTDPVCFVAHHYLRYLGDLSGGQIMARLVQRHYAVTAHELTFFDFAEVGRPKAYRDRYRSALDQAPWSAADQDRFIAECVLGYRLNSAVFDELGRQNW